MHVRLGHAVAHQRRRLAGGVGAQDVQIDHAAVPLVPELIEGVQDARAREQCVALRCHAGLVAPRLLVLAGQRGGFRPSAAGVVIVGDPARQDRAQPAPELTHGRSVERGGDRARDRFRHHVLDVRLGKQAEPG